jgi:hypothetical protein
MFIHAQGRTVKYQAGAVLAKITFSGMTAHSAHARDGGICKGRLQ